LKPAVMRSRIPDEDRPLPPEEVGATGIEPPADCTGPAASLGPRHPDNDGSATSPRRVAGWRRSPTTIDHAAKGHRASTARPPRLLSIPATFRFNA